MARGMLTGNFYTNISVHGIPTEQIFDIIRDLNRRAYVAAAGNGWSIIYDQECDRQDTHILSALADHLASRTGGTALAVLNHDDDVLWFQLFHGQELVSEYASSGGPRTRVADLCRILGHAAATPVVWSILRVPMILEIFRHRFLAKKLGLPLASVGSGFDYIARGEIPQGLMPEQLIEFP
jgi:hypothetical protein